MLELRVAIYRSHIIGNLDMAMPPTKPSRGSLILYSTLLTTTPAPEASSLAETDDLPYDSLGFRV